MNDDDRVGHAGRDPHLDGSIGHAYREFGELASVLLSDERGLADLRGRLRRRARRRRGGAAAMVAAVAALGTYVGFSLPSSSTGPSVSPSPYPTASARPPLPSTPPRTSVTSIAPSTAIRTPRTQPVRDVALFVPQPQAGAVAQLAALRANGRSQAADGLDRLLRTPQGVWFTGGSADSVRRDVDRVVSAAEAKGQVPVLVADNLPFRGCQAGPLGGAADRAAYATWITAFAEGIGGRAAIVILEPDGLGTIPFNSDIRGRPEVCRPRSPDGKPLPGATPEDRYAALATGVERLTAMPKVRTYLDGTHSAWLRPGDAAARLARAGVARTSGFALNVANFQTTDTELEYGRWVSSCLAFASNRADGGWRLGRFDLCAAPAMFGAPGDPDARAKTTAWYAKNLGSVQARTHFVVDTGRNGRGPWAPPDGLPQGDPQVWCNPPGRALGAPPTTKTAALLADAYLWVKVPGTSDGRCHRWQSGGVDPVRDVVDPARGEWFGDAALELVTNAGP